MKIELKSINSLAHKTTIQVDDQPLQGVFSTNLEIEAGSMIRLTIQRYVLDEDGRIRINSDRTDALKETLVYTGRVALELQDAGLITDSE